MKVRRELGPIERAELLQAPTLTLEATALVLGVGMSNLTAALRRGELDLPTVRVGARVIVPTVGVRRLLGLDS